MPRVRAYGPTVSNGTALCRRNEIAPLNIWIYSMAMAMAMAQASTSLSADLITRGPFEIILACRQTCWFSGYFWRERIKGEWIILHDRKPWRFRHTSAFPLSRFPAFPASVHVNCSKGKGILFFNWLNCTRIRAICYMEFFDIWFDKSHFQYPKRNGKRSDRLFSFRSARWLQMFSEIYFLSVGYCQSFPAFPTFIRTPISSVSA